MIDRAAFLNGFVNRPYAKDGLHCWAFVSEVQRELFGRALPLFPEMPELRKVVKLFRDHDERKNWREIPTPVDGAIVMASRIAAVDRSDIHCGVFLVVDGPGLVWHCDEPQGVEAVSPVELTELRRWSLRYFIPAA